MNFQGVSTVGLKIHKSWKHEDIPQIDGKDSIQRETDSWWEEHKKNSLRLYQMYIDVLQDIEDAKISMEEQIFEKENVTNVRKEALAKIYEQCRAAEYFLIPIAYRKFLNCRRPSYNST